MKNKIALPGVWVYTYQVKSPRADTTVQPASHAWASRAKPVKHAPVRAKPGKITR